MRIGALGRGAGLIVLALLGVSAVRAESPAPSWSRSWMFSWPSGPPGTGVAPSVWLDRQRLGASLGGSYAFGWGAGEDEAAALGRSVLEIAALGARPASVNAERGVGAASLRLHRARGREGVWIGASLLGAAGTDDGVFPLSGGGAWMRRGAVTVSFQVVRLLRPTRSIRQVATAPAPGDSFSDGVARPPGLPVPIETRPLTGAETAVAWTGSRLELQSRAGFSITDFDLRRRWGEVRAAVWTRNDLALFARAGWGVSPTPLDDRTRGTDAALGLEWAPGRGGSVDPAPVARRTPGLRLVPAGSGRHRLLLHAVARRVEVISDATDWKPVEARRIADDTWEVELDLVPGVHRIAMRCDGGPWRPPPGIPFAKDEFGGRVGLVVVE